MANGGNLNCCFKAWTRILTGRFKALAFLVFILNKFSNHQLWMSRADPDLFKKYHGWNCYSLNRMKHGKIQAQFFFTLNKYCLKIRIMWKWTTRKEWSILSTIWLQIEMSNSDVFCDDWQSKRKEIWRVTSWPYCF